VVGVTDGDTLKVLHDGRAEVVRLHGIDAPEQGQPFGQRAKQVAVHLAMGHVVTVHVRTPDRYGRTVGDVRLPDGRLLNEALVRAGYAWWFRRYSADPRLAEAEAEARAARPLGRPVAGAAVGVAAPGPPRRCHHPGGPARHEPALRIRYGLY
jgi:endonuclease YncB( thermonuclease family)